MCTRSKRREKGGREPDEIERRGEMVNVKKNKVPAIERRANSIEMKNEGVSRHTKGKVERRVLV
jgi:hypothetical protein